MRNAIIAGIFKDPSAVESTLNNLSEAEFSLKQVSVVMKDTKVAQSLVKPGGPLKGIVPDYVSMKLVTLGFSENNAVMYQDSVNKGEVLLVMQAEDVASDVAKEILESEGGMSVQSITV